MIQVFLNHGRKPGRQGARRPRPARAAAAVPRAGGHRAAGPDARHDGRGAGRLGQRALVSPEGAGQCGPHPRRALQPQPDLPGRIRAHYRPARLAHRELLRRRRLRRSVVRQLHHLLIPTQELTMKRFHVHAHVQDLAASIAFYSKLFGAEPSRLEADYAKWMLDDPRLNFAISTRGNGHVGVDHLGFQTDTPEELGELKVRAEAADLVAVDEGETSCCYARSEKHWVT